MSIPGSLDFIPRFHAYLSSDGGYGEWILCMPGVNNNLLPETNCARRQVVNRLDAWAASLEAQRLATSGQHVATANYRCFG